MTTYAGGTRVRSGYYAEATRWQLVNVEVDGTPLPGGADARYVEVPVVALLAAAPLLGGLFVVALPFIGVGMTAYGLARRLGSRARAGAVELAATVATPAALPGEAHLTGRAASEASEPGAPVDAPPRAGDPTAALEKEIEAQRGTVY